MTPTPPDPTGEEETERRFWRSLRPRSSAPTPARPEPAADTPPPADASTVAAPPVVPASQASDAARERPGEPRTEARRLALRHLLRAAEARVDRASRTRRPVLASGAVVRATHGEISGRTAIVLDADYIESRVLLDLGPDEPHRWLPFAHVGPAEPDC